MTPNIIYEELEGVVPEGPFKAVGTPDGMKAAVMGTKRGIQYAVHRYHGESAWADAIRLAGDMNQNSGAKRRRVKR